MSFFEDELDKDPFHYRRMMDEKARECKMGKQIKLTQR